MSPARFDGLEVIDLDIERTSASWGLLREYLEELGKIEVQDWISFRSNIFSLQDFGSAWLDKIKQRLTEFKPDCVTQHLLEELERIKKALPTLKYCRGEPFKVRRSCSRP